MQKAAAKNPRFLTAAFIDLYQNSPVILPSGVTSIRSAAGEAGSPGIVRISPVSATTKPAPALTFTLRTVTRNPLGAQSLDGSSEKLY